MSSPTPLSAETASEFQIQSRKSAPILIPGAIARWIRGSVFDVESQELPVHESRSLTRLLRSLAPSSSRLVVESLTTPVPVTNVPAGTPAGSSNASRTVGNALRNEGALFPRVLLLPLKVNVLDFNLVRRQVGLTTTPPVLITRRHQWIPGHP